MVRVSIVIPTSNNVPYLSPCLLSLLPSLQIADEVIVVANGADQVTAGYVLGLAREAEDRGWATLRVLQIPEAGYLPAMNAGLAAAQGEYLIMGNDDTLYPPEWLNRMFEGIVVGQRDFPEVRWGLFGPSSNAAMPAQTLPTNKFPNAGNVLFMAETAAACERSRVVALPVGALSGFCLMMTREVYTTIGGLDPRFLGGGYSDNDFQLRAHEAGYGGLYLPRSFVYHYGSVSMTRLTPGHRGGTENLDIFIEKWRHDRPQTIAVNYRVKIDTEADLLVFMESLLRCKTVGMIGAAVVDDRSSLDLRRAFEEYGLSSFVRAYIKNPADAGFNEVRDRNTALQLAQNLHPDWILNLDHDEVIDDAVTSATLDSLTHPSDPSVYSYQFPIFTFWRGTTHVRTDSVWGGMAMQTLFRNLPIFGGIHPVTEGATFHCSRAPTCLPIDLAALTKRFVVKHYGYTTTARALEKQRWYQEMDRFKHVELIGTPNYEHLSDEGSLGLLRYRYSKLSVVFMTRNERYDLLRQVRAWLSYADEVIVLDTGCTDGSAELVAMWGAKVVPWRCCDQALDPEHLLCDFAAARNAAISVATGDYILMLDPDEDLPIENPNYLPLLMMQDCDCYNVIVDNYSPTKKAYRQVQGRLFRRCDGIYYTGRIHETLEESLEQFPNLTVAPSKLHIHHYGFLKTTGADREKKNLKYAERLLDMLQENPNDAKALYALAMHLHETRQYDDGDQLLGQAIVNAPEWFLPRWDLACRFVHRACELLLSASKDRFPHPAMKDLTLEFLKSNLRWCRDPQFPSGKFGEEIPKLLKNMGVVEVGHL